MWLARGRSSPPESPPARYLGLGGYRAGEPAAPCQAIAHRDCSFTRVRDVIGSPFSEDVSEYSDAAYITFKSDVRLGRFILNPRKVPRKLVFKRNILNTRG